MRSVLWSLGLAALVTAALALAGPADAISIAYSIGGTGPMHFPGPIPPPPNAPWGPDGYPGDTVELKPYQGALELVTGSCIQKINTLSWIVDYTYGGTADDPDDWHDLAFDVDGDRSVLLGTEDGALHQTGLLEATWAIDYLSLLEGSTTSFVVQGYTIDVTPLGLPSVGAEFPPGGNPWLQPDRDVYARFDIAPAAAVETPGFDRVAGTDPLCILSLAPNPFHESIRVSYELRTAGPVSLDVYDVEGRLVTTQPLGCLMPGRHGTEWAGNTAGGGRRGSGLYFMRLRGSGVESGTVKAHLLR
jgi:hypothetical protein